MFLAMFMSSGDLGGKPRPLKGRLLVLALAATAGVLIGGGAYWVKRGQAPAALQPATMVDDRSAGRPAIGGPFQLIDQQGRPVTEQVLQGKWTAVFFGYTYCPDICPATLATLQAASAQLGPDAPPLQVVLITVDPARDTPEALKAYLESFEFPGGAHGLTGEPAQVEAAAKAYRVYARRSGEGPDYLMDHATTVYLMNPEGRFDRPLTSGLDAAGMAGQIRAAQGGAA